MDGLQRIAQGRDKACAYISEHPEIAQEIRLNMVEARKAENRAAGGPGSATSGVTAAAAA